MATTVLTRAELESMKRNVNNATDPVLRASQQQVEISKRERDRKKTASANRVSRWKNTLESDRIAKQNWKLQKETEEEAKRLEIDRKEAKYQEKFRLDTIARAENLLYQETAATRALRSSVLYSEVMETRKNQTKERNMVIDGQRDEDARYHSLLMSRISDEEKKEREKKEARQLKSECIARMQEEQLHKSMEAAMARRKVEMEEGDREKAAIAEEIEAEKRKAREEVMKKRLEIERLVCANQDFRAVHDEIIAREFEEINKCKKERETLDRLSAARKKLEAERFARKQCVRQLLIEKATKDLEERNTIADRKEEREYAEITAKKDAEEEEKQRRQRKQMEDIEWSRVEARRIKQEQKSILDKEAAELQEYYEEKAKAVAEEERQKYVDKQRQNIELKEYQKKQAKEIRNRRLAEKGSEQPAEIQMTRSHYEERQKFMRIVESEARKLQSKGAGINLLEKNLAQAYGMKAIEELHQLLLSDRRAG